MKSPRRKDVNIPGVVKHPVNVPLGVINKFLSSVARGGIDIDQRSPHGRNHGHCSEKLGERRCLSLLSIGDPSEVHQLGQVAYRINDAKQRAPVFAILFSSDNENEMGGRKLAQHGFIFGKPHVCPRRVTEKVKDRQELKQATHS